MIKKYKPNIIFFFGVVIAAMTAAAFFDLQIDKALNNPEDIFSIWFRNTGEIPSRLICPLAGTVLFYTYRNRLQKIAGLVITIGGSAYFGYYISKYFFVEHEMIFGLVFGIGFGFVCLLTGKYINIPDDKKNVLRQIAIIGIIVIFAQIMLIEGLKYLWGRVRFRDLIAANSFEQFTPWYKINGINGNKSFPSGHTAGAAMSYMMMFLPYLSEKWKKNHQICFWLPCVYTSVVAFTRLVMGAHYLSDVTIGGTVSFIIVIAAIRIYDTRYKKINP